MRSEAIDARAYWPKAIIVALAIGILLFVGGCGSALNNSIKATNAVTVVLYETRPVLIEAGVAEVKAADTAGSAQAAHDKWIRVFEAFDRVVDAHAAARQAVKAAQAAKAAGVEHSDAKMLVMVLEMTRALEAFLVAFPEARSLLQ